MIKILKPKREDYPEIVSLVNNADKVFLSIYSKEELKYIKIGHENVENLIACEKKRKYLIVKEGAEIVAFASFRLKNEQTVWISSLYVKKNKQKNGYGSILIKRIEFLAKRMKAIVVALETSKKASWAVNFYLKNTYHIIKRPTLKTFPFDKILEKPPVTNRYIFAKEIRK